MGVLNVRRCKKTFLSFFLNYERNIFFFNLSKKFFNCFLRIHDNKSTPNTTMIHIQRWFFLDVDWVVIIIGKDDGEGEGDVVIIGEGVGDIVVIVGDGDVMDEGEGVKNKDWDGDEDFVVDVDEDL